MTEREKLIHDLRTLTETVRLEWQEVARTLDASELQEVKERLDAHINEMRELFDRLENSN